MRIVQNKARNKQGEKPKAEKLKRKTNMYWRHGTKSKSCRGFRVVSVNIYAIKRNMLKVIWLIEGIESKVSVSGRTSWSN